MSQMYAQLANRVPPVKAAQHRLFETGEKIYFYSVSGFLTAHFL